MTSKRVFRPELVDCVLEDRCLPVVPKLGVMAMTTGGLVPMIRFPEAMTTLGGSSTPFGPNMAAAARRCGA